MSNEVRDIATYLESTKSKYSIKSLEFVVYIINQIIEVKGTKISTEDVLESFARLTLDTSGYLWNSCLNEFNIKTWEDIGNIIFLCIEVGIFTKSPEDKLEDFIAAESNSPLVQEFRNLENSGYITKRVLNR